MSKKLKNKDKDIPNVEIVKVCMDFVKNIITLNYHI